MGLLKCSECGSNVSEYADKCQNCGCPIDIIKENQIKANTHTITFIGGESIDLTGIENKISEDELKDSGKIWTVLMEEYGAKISTCSVVGSVFEFNDYKFPENFQKTYEDMCNRNHQRVMEKASHLPKCPTCGSTNVHKISFTRKATSIVGLGILSNKIGKTYQCDNCKATW